MEHFTPKFRYDPNEKVDSLYFGVGNGGTMTSVVKPSLDRNRMETTRTYGPMLPRGQGGLVGTLVLDNCQSTLREMEYILEARREKPLQVMRKPWEIAKAIKQGLERRNEIIEAQRKYFKTNPSEKPKLAKVRIMAKNRLPAGYKMVPTVVPGFRIATKV